MKHQWPKKSNLQRRPSRIKQTSSSKDKVTILFIVLVHTMFSVHILHIYFLEDNMFKEKLYLWKKQQDKDCYPYDYKSENTHERMKYIKQFMWKLLHK
jgi:hypothetical protein